MTSKRKPADARRKDLELAMSRILRGRTHTKASKVSITSVAREAGVTPALIHNHYPEIAETIREAQGQSSRAHRDAKHGELKGEREKNRALRQEMQELRHQVAKLASINEVLLYENRTLLARLGESKVVGFPARTLRG
jgi:AcrR family transcriptional regulator